MVPLTRILSGALGSALAVTLAIPAAAAADAASSAPSETREQWRGYWVDGFNEGVYDADEVAELVTAAEEVDANALVVQVGRRFDCFCNRALYPRTDAAIDPAPYDPLAEVIEQAHAAGIEVHAWVNATTLWNSATRPESPRHAFNRHGLDANGRDRWLNKRADGAELIGDNAFMDPANPAAVNYVVRAIGSITRHYDVDGINLDYIRYPDHSEGEFRNDWGYSETSLARFAAETGRTDRPEPTDPEFSQWRRDQVSNLVRKIYLQMYRVDRSDRLSINGITYAYGPQTYGGWRQTRPYTNVLQDWKGWLDEGIVDTVTAMNYKREWMDDQARMFREWNHALAQYRGDRHVVSGPALYLNEIEDSVQQAQQVDSLPLDGWMGYSYAIPSKRAAESSDPDVNDAERADLASALRDQVFTDEVTVPEMRWKSEPRRGQLSGKVRGPRRVEDQVDVRLTPIGATPGHRQIVRTDGSGWFGVVDLAPGRYRVKVVEPGTGSRTERVRVRAGKVTSVDLRVRRLLRGIGHGRTS